MFFLDIINCNDQEGLGMIVNFLNTMLTLVKILIPIGLILMGSVDLGRAIIEGDEKKIKEHQTRLLKRAIAAVLVFFITALVTALMQIVGNPQWKVCWNKGCWDTTTDKAVTCPK